MGSGGTAEQEHSSSSTAPDARAEPSAQEVESAIPLSGREPAFHSRETVDWLRECRGDAEAHACNES